jgi:hypothetical protein
MIAVCEKEFDITAANAPPARWRNDSENGREEKLWGMSGIDPDDGETNFIGIHDGLTIRPIESVLGAVFGCLLSDCRYLLTHLLRLHRDVMVLGVAPVRSVVDVCEATINGNEHRAACNTP